MGIKSTGRPAKTGYNSSRKCQKNTTESNAFATAFPLLTTEEELERLEVNHIARRMAEYGLLEDDDNTIW